MRTATVDGRAVVLTARGAVDVERHSGARFPADPAALYAQWDEFRGWAAGIGDDIGEPFDDSRLGAPSPRPAQVFAVGLNYAPHAAEAGFARPGEPMVFTKFPSCITGPSSSVPLPGPCVDWEVELVAVIGRLARQVPAADAWDYVAGLTIGQDFSERDLQSRGPAPQFSLAKSYTGFGPTGPWLVTPDELSDPEDLLVECYLGDELVQRGHTRDLLFPLPELIAYISTICPLYPGDLVFTGTPEGTGAGRTPPRYLQPGEEVVSRIEGLGTMRNVCVAADLATVQQ